jgi:hypothetical protein
MSNGLRARIMDVYRIENLGITGGAQPLVLRLKLNNSQNVINNVGSGGHDASIQANAKADAPGDSLPACQTEEWSYGTLLSHLENPFVPKIVPRQAKAFQEN